MVPGADDVAFSSQMPLPRLLNQPARPIGWSNERDSYTLCQVLHCERIGTGESGAGPTFDRDHWHLLAQVRSPGGCAHCLALLPSSGGTPSSMVRPEGTAGGPSPPPSRTQQPVNVTERVLSRPPVELIVPTADSRTLSRLRGDRGARCTLAWALRVVLTSPETPERSGRQSCPYRTRH